MLYKVLQMTRPWLVYWCEMWEEGVKERASDGTFPGGQTLIWQKEKSWQVRWLRLCLIKLHTSLGEKSGDTGLTTETEEVNCGWADQRMGLSYGKQSFQWTMAHLPSFFFCCVNVAVKEQKDTYIYKVVLDGCCAFQSSMWNWCIWSLVK